MTHHIYLLLSCWVKILLKDLEFVILKHMKKLINNLFESKNRPIDVSENRPTEQLVQVMGEAKRLQIKN